MKSSKRVTGSVKKIKTVKEGKSKFSKIIKADRATMKKVKSQRAYLAKRRKLIAKLRTAHAKEVSRLENAGLSFNQIMKYLVKNYLA
jgi:hypothetical protein